MSEIQVGILSIVLVVFLILAGLEIATTLIALSFGGIWLLRDDWQVALNMLSMASFSGIQDYVLATIPLFVLMGMFVSEGDIGKDLFAAAGQLLQKVTGGLAMATVGANAVFAAVTGISVASAAVFTRIAVPELLRNGYSPQLAVGTVAGSSILGMLIPPSILLILYGVLAEQSIGKLFMAAFLPAVIMTIAFCVAIFLLVRFAPGFSHAGAARGNAELPACETGLNLLRRVAPVFALIVVVLGGMYLGWFTPTEAAAVGAFGTAVIAGLRKRLSLGAVKRILRDTGYISATLMVLLVAASLYSRMLSMTGLPEFIAETLRGIDAMQFLMFYILILLALGMILDSSSIMLILLPIAVPIASALQVDLIHFGIITLIAVEIGLLTPPLGLSAFAVKASLDDCSIDLGTVFRGALPFVAVMMLVLGLIVIFPSIVTVVARQS